MNRKFVAVAVSGGMVLAITFGLQRQEVVQSELTIASLNLDEYVGEQTPVPEFLLLQQAVELAHKHGFEGNFSTILPINLTDFDVETMVNEKEVADRGVVIPEKLAEVYFDDQVQAEMEQLIMQKRAAFLEIAMEKGVSERYLEEIEKTTLPAERIHYYPERNYPLPLMTNVHTLEQEGVIDYRKLQLDVYASNIYKIALELEESGLFGDDPYQLRDVATDYVVFHEMTHVLQHAYHEVRTPPLAANASRPWLYSDKTIVEIGGSDSSLWGRASDPLMTAVNMMEMAQESQAETIAVLLTAEEQGLTAEQTSLLWINHFGRLKEAANRINQAFVEMNTWYPELSMGVFVHQLGHLFEIESGLSLEQNQMLKSLWQQLDGKVAMHMGYMNPLPPEQVGVFWQFFGE